MVKIQNLFHFQQGLEQVAQLFCMEDEGQTYSGRDWVSCKYEDE